MPGSGGLPCLLWSAYCLLICLPKFVLALRSYLLDTASHWLAVKVRDSFCFADPVVVAIRCFVVYCSVGLLAARLAVKVRVPCLSFELRRFLKGRRIS